MQKTWVLSLGQKDPLKRIMATHSSILAWKTPWTEEPGGLQSWRFFSLSIWLFAVRLSDWVTNTSTSTGRNTLYTDNNCAYDSSSRKRACAGEEPRGQVRCGERCSSRDWQERRGWEVGAAVFIQRQWRATEELKIKGGLIWGLPRWS